MLYQRSYQPGMQTLQRDKKHLRGVIFLDVIVHQEGSQHELRASEQQEQD